VFNWFPGARRTVAAVRPFGNRPTLERLEERSAPSGLDVTGQLPLSTDLATSPVTAGPVAGAPAPAAAMPLALPTDGGAYLPTPSPVADSGSYLALLTQDLSAPDAPASGPVALPTAGDGTAVMLGQTGSDSGSSTPGKPFIKGTVESDDWHYTVTGSITDPNPTALTIQIKVDGDPKPPVTPDNTGRFTLTFVLPPCYNSANATRYGTAVAMCGQQSSPATGFSFSQHTEPPPNG
jgi:hypothetical protein